MAIIDDKGRSDWLSQLRTASWRDVPFQVDSIEWSAGENTVLREYPFQDLPTVFSMGAGADEIKFSAYVIGDDYLDQLDKLRAVLKGDGVLIHPTAGSMRCWLHGKYTVREAPTSMGGVARLDLTFVRAEARRYPAGATSTSDQVASAADTAEKSLIDSLAANFSLSDLAGWAHDNVLDRMRSGLDVLWDGISYVNRALDTYNSLVSQYVTFPLTELAAIPGQLGSRIADLLAIPETLTSNQAWDAFSAARNLWKAPSTSSLTVDAGSAPQAIAPSIAAAYASAGFVPNNNQAKLAEAFTPDPSPYETATRTQVAQALKTLEGFFNGVVTIMAVRAVAQIELENYDQAVALRSDLNQQINELLIASAAEPVGGVGDVTTHDALVALQTAVLTDLQSRSRDLARLTTYTPESWQPAIYISYRMFGTVSWADEILAMNPSIRHPLLVPPGIALRVIKHD
ncbi:DNA circularization family protein [Burkholderia cepacia]|uniref:Phage tail protein n=1 Tax=Burkholderia cenocepacia (strain ATCC BAA-245 / DSM 16553 / LMG 16656 / NCTC 13227 / J2315 / CF5610) TaxID=216591 RepID=B4E863_BURCJ|nr:DNA circularization N-terminal domain-containing protein [Burkholderia cenocepacia]KIS47238.1 DNA circularization family protein [Burkholderia cepacia]PNE60964.1 multidrug DMT transporter [Burkholderia cenocepacia]QKT96695.1 DNA circularization N-terminal domain-containing protein [Burkholderia cenocepacia]CAR51866.1 putative phage tail protein [Burkholderia cenocepacia J2315]SPV08490.1 putative phage tail protein [Burkholderia cenocepacia]